MHGLIALFLEVIMLAISLLFIELVAHSPCHCTENDHGVNRLNSQFIGCRDCISCFDDGCGYGDNVAYSLIHGCLQWEDKPSSSLVAASCPWQSS